MINQSDEYKKLVEQSQIPAEDKGLWLKNADTLAGSVLENLIYLFQEMPNSLIWLNGNLKRKIEAVKSGDKDAWSRIITDEKNKISEI